MGDLIVTCTSMNSPKLPGRHPHRPGHARPAGHPGDRRRGGGLLRRGLRPGAGQAGGVEMPITQAAYQVLYEGRDPKTVLQELMRREKRHEMEETWI